MNNNNIKISIIRYDVRNVTLMTMPNLRISNAMFVKNPLTKYNLSRTSLVIHLWYVIDFNLSIWILSTIVQFIYIYKTA